uniref:DUF6293 domain-containing protein n=1 Tax=uncultured marine thaumarchaeote KM3_51_F10 TaxID=1456175 RepID=A0A075H583_9ARCH|nr:hypothetical protein [uncultured marine thaumarchaeote KM3_51_F10]
MTEIDNPSKDSDMLIDHLLDAKRKHDEDKNVEKEEVEHLEKGADYLVSFLVGQGVQVSQPKKVTKQKPPGLEELKKKFVENLVEEGYVTVNDSGRTILTENGKKFLDNKTKSADTKVAIAKLKNLQFRNNLDRQNKRMANKAKKGLKTKIKGIKKKISRKSKRR